MDGFFSGTSNMVLPVKNKSFFPAEFQNQTRLTYYSHLFNSLEVNASFYKTPLARTVAKWSSEVPDDFRFTFKLIEDVTHLQKQTFNLNPVHDFINRISATPKRGCLLIQLPPKFAHDIVQLELLLLETKDCGWDIAIEFRHPGWYNDHIFQILHDNDVAMVIHDMPKSRAPMELTSDKFAYIRFHGPESGYQGSYTDAFLHEYSEYIREWRYEGKTVYCYFNNTLGAAVHNLQTLNQFMELD
jgi:uncharacterized protein YecE (DUF72 family)